MIENNGVKKLTILIASEPQWLNNKRKIKLWERKMLLIWPLNAQWSARKWETSWRSRLLKGAGGRSWRGKRQRCHRRLLRMRWVRPDWVALLAQRARNFRLKLLTCWYFKNWGWVVWVQGSKQQRPCIYVHNDPSRGARNVQVYCTGRGLHGVEWTCPVLAGEAPSSL